MLITKKGLVVIHSDYFFIRKPINMTIDIKMMIGIIIFNKSNQ